MRNGNYALITGASEGFGKALALECAARQMNLLLVALPGSGLENLAGFIRRNFEVNVYCFEHDLSRKEECYQLIGETEELNLPVNILINNAGIGGTHLFEERSAAYYNRMIDLNVTTPTLLTYLFLEKLEQQAPSYILNVSSLASFFCLPRKQVYGATKSYLVSFTKSLRQELKRKKIFVSTVCPGAMNTKLDLVLYNKTLKGLSRWSVMNPEEVARISIDGMFAKKEVMIPGICNRIFMLMDKLLPKRMKEWLIDKQMSKSLNPTNPITPSIHPLKTAI
jgi:short-subunit dehydrogenase